MSLDNPFTGRELFQYWKDNVTFRRTTVSEWEELLPETKDRWQRFAAMINQRMRGEK